MLHHPLTQNPWSVDTDREFGPVSLFHLHQIDRARYAIQTIARMVGNSASEPDATGSPPLDAWTVATLMGEWKVFASMWVRWPSPCWNKLCKEKVIRE
ncbi:hypothetical protein WJ976_06440 [Achromobacter denitrificans]